MLPTDPTSHVLVSLFASLIKKKSKGNITTSLHISAAPSLPVSPRVWNSHAASRAGSSFFWILLEINLENKITHTHSSKHLPTSCSHSVYCLFWPICHASLARHRLHSLFLATGFVTVASTLIHEHILIRPPLCHILSIIVFYSSRSVGMAPGAAVQPTIYNLMLHLQRIFYLGLLKVTLITIQNRVKIVSKIISTVLGADDWLVFSTSWQIQHFFYTFFLSYNFIFWRFHSGVTSSESETVAWSLPSTLNPCKEVVMA